jgi:hypothetical protein
VKHIWIQLLFLFTLPLLLPKAALGQSPGIAYVYTQTASLWKEPGYSWRVCDQLHKKDAINDFETLMKTSENCNRTYLQGGDEVMVLTEGKKLKSVDKDIVINGQHQKMKFYYVEVTVKNADGTYHRERGWMSADQMTTPEQDQEAAAEIADVKAATQPEKKPTCPPQHKNSTKEAQKNASEIQNHLANQLALGPIKSDDEINHFACLYRRHQLNDAQFDRLIPEFSKAAKKAEKAFQVPYAVTMCTMLIESGLYYDSKENDEYKGLGQFGSAMVEDLEKLVKDSKSHFGQKWNQYTSSDLNDKTVRSSSNPEVATGAVALMMNWLYEQRLPAANCHDCSRNDQFNRRDLYLMVAGYNYSPYAIDKFANRPLAKIQSSFPPPRETRNYMTQMDRCLEKGQEKKFRVGKDDKKEIMSHEYKDRKKTCDQKYPVK